MDTLTGVVFWPICWGPFQIENVSVPSLTVAPLPEVTVAASVKVWSLGLKVAVAGVATVPLLSLITFW